MGGGDDDDSSTSEAACELARGVTVDKILFGSSQPMTGNLAALGYCCSRYGSNSKDRINEGGGINGRMIEFIVQDDAYNPEKPFLTLNISLSKKMFRDLGKHWLSNP